MIDKSFLILRANPSLSGNVKLVVSSNYQLYLESYNANQTLMKEQFKHFLIKNNEYWKEVIPAFFTNVDNTSIFDVRNINDVSQSYTDYRLQFDDTYFCGAQFTEDNYYNEEFEYSAPLYIKRNSIPTDFIILRVDGLGSVTQDSNQTNFRTNILNNLKFVKSFDLSPSSDLGAWLKSNFIDDINLPTHSVIINNDDMTLSQFTGIDLINSGWSTKSLNLFETQSLNTPIFKTENIFGDIWKTNNIIYPDIINFKFLFDDTPATPTSLRNYSINRYLGFYIDEKSLVMSVSPFKTFELNITPFDVIETLNPVDASQIPFIKNNTFVSKINGRYYSFDPIKNGWIDGNTYWVEWEGNYYNIKKVTNTLTNVFELDAIIGDFLYQIISPITIQRSINDLISIDNLSQSFIDSLSVDDLSIAQRVLINDLGFDYPTGTTYKNRITVTNQIVYNNIIGNNIIENSNTTLINFQRKYQYLTIDGITALYFTLTIINSDNTFSIPNFEEADLYLIDINSTYYVLKQYDSNLLNLDNKYYINSDYAINIDSSNITTWINNGNLTLDNTYYHSTGIENITLNDTIPFFNIYRINFSDVKDFDFDRVETNYTRYEYEKKYSLEQNIEPKFYAKEYRQNPYNVHTISGERARRIPIVDENNRPLNIRDSRREINYITGEAYRDIDLYYTDLDGTSWQLLDETLNGTTWSKYTLSPLNLSRGYYREENYIWRLDDSNGNLLGLLNFITNSDKESVYEALTWGINKKNEISDPKKPIPPINSVDPNEQIDNNFVPVSSEYINSDELWELYNNDLTEIWNKNQSVVKWGALNSLGAHDYDYRLNYSLDCGIYNNNPNPNTNRNFPERDQQNLDYFYRFNLLNNSQYQYYTLHLNADYFDIDKYLSTKYNYFETLFKSDQITSEGIQLTNKYSSFININNYADSETIFRGVKYLLSDVNEIIFDEVELQQTGKIIIDDIITSPNIKYSDYKFSIVFGKKLSTFNNNYIKGSGNSNMGIDIYLNDYWKNVVIHLYIDTDETIQLIDPNTNQFVNAETSIIDLWYNDINDTNVINPQLWDNLEFKINNFGINLRPRNFKLLDILNIIQNKNFNPMGEINIEKINFVHIYDQLDSDGNLLVKVMNWENTDFVLSSVLPTEIIVKEKAFLTEAVDNSLIPQFHINNSLENRLITSDINSNFTSNGLSVNSINDINSYNNYPIAKNITPNTLDTRLSWGLDTSTDPSIFRFNGVYAPIFKNISLFRPLMYNELRNNGGTPLLSSGNWKFYDSNSSNTSPNVIGFGQLEELLFSKCNSNTSILQIQDPTNKDKSVYPMVDEYGYDFDARFIFASSFEPSYNYLSRSIFVPVNPSPTLAGYTIHYDGVSEFLRISDQEKFNQETYLVDDCNYNNYTNNLPTGESVLYNLNIDPFTNSNRTFNKIINIVNGVDYNLNFNYSSFPSIGSTPSVGESNVYVSYTFNFIAPNGTLIPVIIRDNNNNLLSPPNTPNSLVSHDNISTILYIRSADNNSLPPQYLDFNTYSLQITIVLETILQFYSDELIIDCNISMLTSTNFLDIETDNYYLENNKNNTVGDLLFGSFIKLNSESNNIYYYPAYSNITNASKYTIPQLNNYDTSNVNVLGQKLWMEFSGLSVNKRPGRIGVDAYNYTQYPIPQNWSGYIYIDILNRLRSGAGTYLMNAIIVKNNYGWLSYTDPNNILTTTQKFDRCCLYHFLEYGSQPTPSNVIITNLAFNNSRFGESTILNEFYKMTGFYNFSNRNFNVNYAYNTAPNESVGIMRISNPNNFTFEPDRTSYLLDGKKALYVGQPNGTLSNPYVILQWTMNFRDTRLLFNIVPQNGNTISVSLPLVNPTTNVNYNFNDILISLNKILASSAYQVSLISTFAKTTVYKIYSSVDGSYYNFDVVLLTINDFSILSTNTSQSISIISEKFTKTSLMENRRTGRINATTVEFWIQATSWEREWETILYKGDDSGSDGWLDTSFTAFTYIIGKFGATDKLAFKTCHENLTGGYTTHILTSNLEINDNKWHHIVCISDMLTMTKQIWIDGELDIQTIGFLEPVDSNGNIINRTPESTELLAQFVERRSRFIHGIQNPSMTFDNILANKIRLNSQDSVTQYWINIITGVIPAKYSDLIWQYSNWSTTIDVAYQLFVDNYISLNYYLNVDANILNWDILLGTDSTINNGNRNFEGLIDELRIWNYRRTTSEIQATWRYSLNPNAYYNPLESLIAYFRFDEGQGFNQLSDLTNNKLVKNMVRWTANTSTYINNGRKINEINNTKYFYFIESFYNASPILIDDEKTDWDESGAIILGIIDERNIPQSPPPIMDETIRDVEPVIFNNTKSMLLKRRLSRIIINIKTTIFNYTVSRTFKFTPVKWWLFKTVQSRVEDTNQSSNVKIQIERTGTNWLTQISNLINKKRN